MISYLKRLKRASICSSDLEEIKKPILFLFFIFEIYRVLHSPSFLSEFYKVLWTKKYKFLWIASSSRGSPCKDVLVIYSKFTGEHPFGRLIAIKLLCNIIKITLKRGCSPVSLPRILKTPFYKNTSGEILMFLKI